ncbi:MAG TPA: DUF488 domain-containing protein [Planctomycetota bacterium]|nr:DUF488 domain-containing protein [Planctomycetota bacterium]
MRIWTVGHSNLGIAGFVVLLEAHGIEALADVRAFPRSTRWPHFSGDRLAAAWEDYHWLGKELGGYRKEVRNSSPHVALDGMWRAYADHMEGEAFRAGIARLLAIARERPAAIMCAERLWNDCHRRHIADHLAGIEGVDVLHITGSGPPDPHRVDPRARVDGARLVYDLGTQRDLF